MSEEFTATMRPVRGALMVSKWRGPSTEPRLLPRSTMVPGSLNDTAVNGPLSHARTTSIPTTARPCSSFTQTFLSLS